MILSLIEPSYQIAAVFAEALAGKVIADPESLAGRLSIARTGLRGGFVCSFGGYNTRNRRQIGGQTPQMRAIGCGWCG
jgi:hypothetical protein